MRPRIRDASDKPRPTRPSFLDGEPKFHRKHPPPLRTMLGRWRKWTVLVAAIWIQASTGTNFDFSAYSSHLKSVLGISQVRLNYLAVASDLGKAFGWSSGIALGYCPLSVVLYAAAAMGFVGYGVQWLVITNVITLPYSLVFLCCLLAGLSICWFNTACFILCIRHFPTNRALALSLTVSFNGISAALYSLAFNAINPTSSNMYLLLNSLLPLGVSLAALYPLLIKPSLDPAPDRSESRRHDSHVFAIMNAVAVVTSFHLLLSSSSTNVTASARFHLAGAIFLLVFPLCAPLLVYARDYYFPDINHRLHNDTSTSGYVMLNIDELKIQKASVTGQNAKEGNNIVRLGDEHSFQLLITRFEFWLYYIAYFCGGTIGLVYSNNLGQIAQTLGKSSTTLVTIYSSFSFFGRLLSAAPDFMHKRFHLTRTGWFTFALLPTPIAFFLLAISSLHQTTLQTATALIGLSSGFIFAAAVSITSELFGPNSVGVNHNILITNIPIGSLLYGFIAASIYEANANLEIRTVVSDSVVCIGRDCYHKTFAFWGCLSLLGLASSLLLYLRTKPVYHRLEQERVSVTTSMGDFGYLSDTDESAVEELISQAKELSALEQIAAINCSGFTDSSTLPDDLESRFRRLKSLPAARPDPVSSKISKKDLTHSKSVAFYQKDGDFSGNPGKQSSGFDEDSSTFSGNKRDLVLEKSSRDGSGDFSDSSKRTQKLLPKQKGSFDLATPPSSSDSEPEKKSKSKSSSSSWIKKLSPAKIIGYIWSSPNKSSSTKKKNIKSIKSFTASGRERDVDFDEFLSDLNAYSVEDQRKMLKKALKEQQKMRKEAAEIIKMTKKASARFDFDD
ncbi:unnamed protein product [Eruca vesicaria subsp. sativa]|uniref:Nodulin-like domain-containing protein n=1 Tax=Eruca vesicaria subsp. sativa TaxID=29727 RepID=A0ABC8JM97_ERUVS|nr:unnamed protein product [Eruca vesicaria subsp. sativa]